MELKTFFKFFVLLFLISFLIINWNQISWIFNYRTISTLLSDFFTGYDNGQDGFYQKEDSLEIPKIEIFVPLVFTETAETKEIVKSLDFGAVHFFDSVLPGEKGETIILGHSAPPGWPKIKYDWVFTRINELADGDEIIVYFNNKKLTYSVTNKFFLERGEEIPEYLTNYENVLILISCWPPGKDIRRIAIQAYKI